MFLLPSYCTHLELSWEVAVLMEVTSVVVNVAEVAVESEEVLHVLV